ncbi:MAG: methionyl-tRNA synthetase [Burkholderiales bacterium]|jgi:methionyl-tRNA synthetase|nr:methionyl-tRNA synthetase [Burkholderiales bacterium]
MSSYFIEVPPPTPNGNLHLGHIAGPYLAADLYNRTLRLNKKSTFFACDLDRNQSYVRLAATQQDKDYTTFLNEQCSLIESTFASYEIGFDVLIRQASPTRDLSIKNFADRLLQSRYVREKEVEFYYNTVTNTFLVEGYISGKCPKCYASVKGGVCELCGFYNCSTEIVEPMATLDPSLILSKRKCMILVINLAQFRNQLKEILEVAEINQAAKEFIYDNLLECDCDFPITLPLEDGIIIDESNNKLNPWVEILGGTYYLKGMAQNKFNKNNENKFIHTCFMGIDNAFYYAVVFNVIRHILAFNDFPKRYYINKYYLLGERKFSTSRGNVIWAHEALTQFSVDCLRVFLAATYPLNDNYNFTWQQLVDFNEDINIQQACVSALANFKQNYQHSVANTFNSMYFYECASVLIKSIASNSKLIPPNFLFLLQVLLPKTSERFFRELDKFEQITEQTTCSFKKEFGINLNRLIYLSENDFCVSIAMVESNQQTVPHQHEDLEEVFFIIAGSGVMYIGDSSYIVKKNDYIYIPSGALHSIKQCGKENLNFVTIAWKSNDKTRSFKLPTTAA